MSDQVKIRFANNYVDGPDRFELGGVYEVSPSDARHYVRIGKAQRVPGNTKTNAEREAEANKAPDQGAKNDSGTAAKK